jgi:hypothetical protein
MPSILTGISPALWRGMRLVSQVIAWLLLVLVVVIIGFGWLYLLRQLRWFGVGPAVGDSLPLLQLAAADRQPLLRVILAWALTGLLLGAGLSRASRLLRTLAGLAALLLLLVGSQAAFALTRNEPFGQVVFSRLPALGPWLEGALLTFALGVAPQRAGARRGTQACGSSAVSFGESLIGVHQHGNTSKHRRDRGDVCGDRERAGSD